MEIGVLIEERFEGCPEESWLRSVAEQVLIAQGSGPAVEMSLVITGQDRVHELNRAYRGIDEPTDVLSFSMLLGEEEPEADSTSFIAPPDGVIHLGEVIVSYPQAVIQAGEHQHPIEKEIAVLVVHGVLHLLGYDHDKAELERDMRARELEILSRIEESFS